MPRDSVKAYQETVERIEPDVHPLDRDGALASIAISQKRQADALERLADCFEYNPQITNIWDLLRALDK